MRQTFNSLAASVLLAALGISCLASAALDKDIHRVQDIAMRSANTCADPSLTRTFFQGYDSKNTLHVLRVREDFVNADTRQGSVSAPMWSLQGAVFKAWQTQQPFTVPLFRLQTPTGTDTLFAIGIDAQTPPVVTGFNAPILIAWVYNTSTCDSVPLMSAALASETDHYWTTDANEHAGILAQGWTDGGVVAYVLPLSTL